MKDTLITVVALATVTTGLAIVPIPEVAFVLQGAGLGALVGTWAAQRLKGRGSRVDTGTIVARWSIAGAAPATILLIGDWLVGE